MFHKVSDVKPLENFELLVSFIGGEKKIYDVKPLFEKWEIFRSLKTINGLFQCVRVDTGGYGIVWNDEIDLACDELWEEGALCR